MQGHAQIDDTVELLEHALVIPWAQTGALQPRLLLGRAVVEQGRADEVDADAADELGGAGAGDAFCAGVLVGIHEGWELQEGLRFGTAAAAACLGNATCTEGVTTHTESMKLFDRFPLKPSAL